MPPKTAGEVLGDAGYCAWLQTKLGIKDNDSLRNYLAGRKWPKVADAHWAEYQTAGPPPPVSPKKKSPKKTRAAAASPGSAPPPPAAPVPRRAKATAAAAAPKARAEVEPSPSISTAAEDEYILSRGDADEYNLHSYKSRMTKTDRAELRARVAAEKRAQHGSAGKAGAAAVSRALHKVIQRDHPGLGAEAVKSFLNSLSDKQRQAYERAAKQWLEQRAGGEAGGKGPGEPALGDDDDEDDDEDDADDDDDVRHPEPASSDSGWGAPAPAPAPATAPAPARARAAAPAPAAGGAARASAHPAGEAADRDTWDPARERRRVLSSALVVTGVPQQWHGEGLMRSLRDALGAPAVSGVRQHAAVVADILPEDGGVPISTFCGAVTLCFANSAAAQAAVRAAAAGSGVEPEDDGRSAAVTCGGGVKLRLTVVLADAFRPPPLLLCPLPGRWDARGDPEAAKLERARAKAAPRAAAPAPAPAPAAPRQQAAAPRQQAAAAVSDSEALSSISSSDALAPAAAARAAPTPPPARAARPAPPSDTDSEDLSSMASDQGPAPAPAPARTAGQPAAAARPKAAPPPQRAQSESSSSLPSLDSGDGAAPAPAPAPAPTPAPAPAGPAPAAGGKRRREAREASPPPPAKRPAPAAAERGGAPRDFDSWLIASPEVPQVRDQDSLRSYKASRGFTKNRERLERLYAQQRR